MPPRIDASLATLDYKRESDLGKKKKRKAEAKKENLPTGSGGTLHASCSNVAGMSEAASCSILSSPNTDNSSFVFCSSHCSHCHPQLLFYLLFPPHPKKGKSTYIASSYIKYLESAGARVVPLHYKDPLDKLTSQFKMLNGLLYVTLWLHLIAPKIYCCSRRRKINLVCVREQQRKCTR